MAPLQEYESNDSGEEDEDADLENLYYSSKGYKDEDADRALSGFQQVRGHSE